MPQLVSCFKEGMSWGSVLQDALVGVVVAVIALPLSLAFAIGSGLEPAVGLYTAIVAGFIVAILGGSRFQVAGPTGAFVVVVYDVVQRQGFDGLVLATLMAGFLLIVMGALRLGVFLKYIPYPVVTGMTSGIAVVLFTSQFKDLLGLVGTSPSVSFLERWGSYIHHLNTWHLSATLLGFGVIALILLLRRISLKIPGAIIAVIIASLLVYYLGLSVETVESRFGEIPSTLPAPSWPEVTVERIKNLMPDVLTLTVLAAIESLLSAVVADSMSGTKHRSDMELVAQGFGNIGSALFGGLPVTGAIARTATNVRLGAKTPISAAVHAIVLFFILFLFAGLAGKMPLCALAGIVTLTAWMMFEAPHFWQLLRSSRGDALLLLSTFTLTVLIDITVAVEIGVLLAALLFTKKMADVVSIKKTITGHKLEVAIQGPLFFAASTKLDEELASHKDCQTVILKLHDVSVIDASGIQALKKFASHCKKRGQTLVLEGANPFVLKLLDNAGKIV